MSVILDNKQGYKTEIIVDVQLPKHERQRRVRDLQYIAEAIQPILVKDYSAQYWYKTIAVPDIVPDIYNFNPQ